MTYTAQASRYAMLEKVMKKQGYHYVNEHTVVKPCLWTRKAILEKKFCYKCLFYGIESHRCIQMSPSAYWCWNDCVHCWRIRPPDVGLPFELKMPPYKDDVKEIVDKMIVLQRKLLSGYHGNPKADKRLLEEALQPKHVAISLTGEPTLYENLPEFIRELHRRGLTSFLVTRGIRPDIIERLAQESPPTQLYVSLEAYDRDIYQELNKPLVPRAWELTEKTLEMMSSFPSPTVLRITLIKDINTDSRAVKGFAKLIEISRPTYIEVKAYMHVGSSVHRLSKANMPTFNDVFQFSARLSEEAGVPIRSYAKESRVVLMSSLSAPIRHGNGCPNYLWLK